MAAVPARRPRMRVFTPPAAPDDEVLLELLLAAQAADMDRVALVVFPESLHRLIELVKWTRDCVEYEARVEEQDKTIEDQAEKLDELKESVKERDETIKELREKLAATDPKKLIQIAIGALADARERMLGRFADVDPEAVEQIENEHDGDL